MINQLDIFVRNLKNILNDRKIKVNDMAKRMGVSGPYVSNIIGIRQTPSIGFILKASEVLDVTVAELFTPDIRQFPVKQDLEEANLMEIIDMQKDQIASLEEELELVIGENEGLTKELLRRQFKEDVVVDESVYNDGKIKLFIKNGEAYATVNDVNLKVDSKYFSSDSAYIKVMVDEVHIEY